MRGLGATGGAGATRGTGSSGGIIGASPTGVEFGLDVGIGQLGISTDYGGGVVVKIFGQKIVWGREGGKIHYNFGGLEVIVEARNCVVTETRKIWGQVVGRHVYPDPGCKLPEEPKNPKPKLGLPPFNPNDIRPIDSQLPDSDQLAWVVVNLFRYYYAMFYSRIDGNLVYEVEWSGEIGEDTKVINKIPVVELNTIPNIAPFTITRQILMKGGVPNPNYLMSTIIPTRRGFTFVYIDELTGKPQDSISIGTSTSSSGVFATYQGKLKDIKKFIKLAQEQRIARYNKFWLTKDSSRADFILLINVVEVIGLPNDLPTAGNQPPMTDKCCQALKADIAEIKKVLATKEILAGKMTFPWVWRMPGGQGEEKIMDYPNLMRAIAQMIDHLGIHPPKLSVKDINNAIAGDQSVSNQFPSATQGFEALMAQVWDSNADVDTLTNFLYRLSWLCVQQSMNLARLSGDIQSIKDMLGGETQPEDTSLTTPFNIGAGIKERPTKGQGFGKNGGKGNKKERPTKGQGFGKNGGKGNKIDGKIDLNTEVATESLLPDFLKIRENPIVVERFSGDKDVFDLLTIIILKLESLQRT